MARLLLAVAWSPLSLRVKCSPTSEEDRRCGDISTDLRQSTERRLLRQRSRRRQGKGHGGRGEAGQGIWRLGGTFAAHPPRRVLGKYSLPLGSLLVNYTASGVEQLAIPMGSLSFGKRSAIQRFLPTYPPVELWFMLAESTIPGPNGDRLFYVGRSPR